MEIRFSKYNEPFTEQSGPNVHYISLDDQRDMHLGAFDAHVRAYLYRQFDRPLSFSTRTFRIDNSIEVYDPISGTTRIHDLTGANFVSRFSAPAHSLSVDETQVLDELFLSGVKAATPRLSRCECGNANRPWRCTCSK